MSRTVSSKAFLSAYHNEVTGSRLLLTLDSDERKYRILIDCGYYQEIEYRYLNYIDDINPTTIDAIFVTHNHIDHTGLIPKLVRQGYRNPVYTTNYTKELMPEFLKDSCKMQPDNANYMKEKYPEDADKFEPLYDMIDVENTMKLCKGIDFDVTFEAFPGIKVTFFGTNGHLLGAAMIYVEFQANGKNPMNYLFTGDYKLRNVFFDVPKLPAWVRKKEIILINESTYGTTNSKNVNVCFIRNLLDAFKQNKNILIGAFAQGRYQEVLYDLKKLESDGLIPANYRIEIDGPLGIDTTYKYKKILETFNPECADFIPERTKCVNPKEREDILANENPVILITTSGMLSNGPARIYVPLFLECPNALIHLIGYAAEETLARTLLNAKDKETITIGGKVYQKKAEVKATSEKSSHATSDEMINFINSFKKIRFLGINHGSEETKDGLEKIVRENCLNVKETGILNRSTMYAFYQFADENEKYNDIHIKMMSAKLDSVESLTDKAKKKKELRAKRTKKQNEKARKKASKRKLKVKKFK